MLSIQVEWSSGLRESFTVETASVRIGSAAYCEVRLPMGEAAADHVALEYTGLAGGLLAEALANEPVATIGGAPFTRELLAPDAVLQIGSTKIKAAPLEVSATSGQRAKEKTTSPLAYVAAIALVPYALSQLPSGKDDEVLRPKADAPALFSKERVSCPQQERDMALARAEQELRLADAKRERRPFRAYDGVLAVGLYRTASACFEHAGRPSQKARAEQAAQRLERDLNESYRTHRLRLEHALGSKNQLLARSEVQVLRDLTSGASGDYVTWLASLERRLALSEGKKK